MRISELDDIEKEILMGKVVERARADLNEGRPLTEMRREEIEMKKECPRCGSSMRQGAPHVDGPCVQWECYNCGKIIVDAADGE